MEQEDRDTEKGKNVGKKGRLCEPCFVMDPRDDRGLHSRDVCLYQPRGVYILLT
jgi:hypothetical protein